MGVRIDSKSDGAESAARSNKSLGPIRRLLSKKASPRLIATGVKSAGSAVSHPDADLPDVDLPDVGVPVSRALNDT